MEAANTMAARLNKDYGVVSRWEGSAMHFERSGLSGVLTLTPGQLALDVKLGFLMSAMREKIANAVERKLDEEFGGTSAPAPRGVN